MSLCPLLIGFTGGAGLLFGCAVLAYFATSHAIEARSIARRFRSLLPLKLVSRRESKIIGGGHRPQINCDRECSEITGSSCHTGNSVSPVTPMLGEVSSTSWTILSPQCSERKGFPEIQFDDWLEASAACAGRQSSLRGIPERRLSPDSGGASPHVPVASRRSCTESFYGSVVAEPVSDAPVTSLSRPSDRLLQRPRSPQSRAEAEQDSAHFTTEIVICGQDEGASDPKVSARSVPRTDDMNNNWASSPPSDQSLASIKRPPMAAISCDCGANLDLPMFPEMMEHNPTMSGGDSGQGKIRTF